MGKTTEGVIHGVVEHIMIEGGTLGTPGSEYAIESMPPENPAMSVRVYKEENGMWKPTAYSIGMMHNDAIKVEMENNNMSENDEDKTYKAEKPNYADFIKPRSGGSRPTNPRLYASVVQAAKDKFDVYPSAVANSWVVQEYKRRGGTYSSEKVTKSIWDNSMLDPRGFVK